MANELLIYLGLVLGVFLRTIIPYLNLRHHKGDLAFDVKYVATALISLGFAASTAETMLATYVPPVGDSAVVAFLSALIYAWLLNQLTNTVADKGTA